MPLSAHAWKPPVAGIREVFHARFLGHAYPPHVHDVWTLFLVDHGAVTYDLHRRTLRAEPSSASILPPHVVHDGRPATSDGYIKRVLYLEPDVIGEHLVGPAVDRPLLAVPGLRDEVSALDHALAGADDALEAEGRLWQVVDRIRTALGDVAPDVGDPRRAADLAESLRAYLDTHLAGRPTIAEAAGSLDASPTRVAKAFSDTFGIAPHAYLTGRRLEAARSMILEGRPLADVALDAGFADQAHLTRRFKEFLGVTPGRFAAG